MIDQHVLKNAILLFDKPEGITSFEAVKKVRRFAGITKAGHSGTLDKFASGLLIIALGKSTRFLNYLIAERKRYSAEIKLGVATDTFDCYGKVTEISDVSRITEEMVLDAVLSFKGKNFQRPPDYSALKIKGVRASDLARKGIDPGLKVREVEIFNIQLLAFDVFDSIAKIEVICSKGTYVRSLARDIGEKLGVAASLKSLRRTEIGDFSVRDALSIEQMTEEQILHVNKKFLITPEDVFKSAGVIIINEEAAKRVNNGAVFSRDAVLSMKENDSGFYMILDEKKNLIAIADVNFDNWQIKYRMTIKE